MSNSIFHKLGTLKQRLKDRVGRKFGTCRTCGKPTRSHSIGDGLQCHTCFSEGNNVIIADGGQDMEQEPNSPPGDISIEDIVDYTTIHEGEYEKTMAETPSWTITDWATWRDPEDPPLTVWMPWAEDEYAWSEGDYASFEKAMEAKEKRDAPYLAFLHQDPEGTYNDTGDNLILGDWDDVRDPETGEVIPEVYEWKAKLGLTYSDISKSGTGGHDIWKGSLPEGFETGFTIKLRDEPVFGHDGPPKLEIWDRKRANYTTGERVDGTPREAQPVNGDALLEAAEKHGKETTPPEDYDKDRETVFTQEEVESVGETSNWDIIFDAISHAEPRDAGGRVRLRSKTTNERNDGTLDIDPSFEQSKSGTRLGYDDGTFFHRAENVAIDILQVVALEEHIISSPNEYPEGEDFNDAVDELRRRGAHIPEYDPDEDDADPFGIIPVERLKSLPHEERRRYAKRRGLDWPSVDEVRDRLSEDIRDAVDNERTVVKSAPTGAGKTHAVATTPWAAMPDVTNDQPVVHAHGTREARDQARGMSDEAGVDAYTLKGRTELCDVAAGYHDPDNEFDNRELTIDGVAISEWMDHRSDRQGIPFSVVHRWAEQEVGEDLPCQHGQGECPALTQFDGIPRDDDGNPSHDVIHATHQFLLVPGLRLQTNIVIDEKPSFGIDLQPESVRKSVNAYLDYIDAPVDSYSELVKAAETGRPPDVGKGQNARGLTYRELKRGFKEEMDEALNGRNTYQDCPVCNGGGELEDETGHVDVTTAGDGDEAYDGTCGHCAGTGSVVKTRGKPPLTWYKENTDAHALAPAFARAIWEAEESAGDLKHARVPFYPPRFDTDVHDSAAWNRVYVDVVLDDQWEVKSANSVPDFSLSNSVIGLDAHPAPRDPQWMVDVHPDIETEYTIDGETRTLYRRLERGLFTVQVGKGIQPVTTGEWLDQGQGKKFTAIVQQLADEFPEEFDSAITSMAAKDFVRRSMETAGIDDPDMMHYGNEESRNDFAGKEVGLVIGSIDPGDDMIMNLLARLDMDAEPATKECPVCEGTGHVHDGDEPEMCETCMGDGEVRERGRTFVGDDADMADNVLKSVREHHVAQSAGRWARNADDPDDHATVFIVTEAAPDGFIDVETPGVTWTANENQRQIIEAVNSGVGGKTAKEIAAETGIPKRTVNRTLKMKREDGTLEYSPGKGENGATLYWPGEQFNPYGTVDIADGADVAAGAAASSQGAYGCNDTWVVAVRTLPHVAMSDYDDAKKDWKFQTGLDWFERANAPPT